MATYETSLYNEWGERRSDFGLADVFGVTFRNLVPGPMHNAYLRLEDDPRTGKRHPILAGLEDAPRIIHGTYRLDVAPKLEFRHSPLTLIPSYPNLPMEKVYPRVPKTDIAELYLRQVGSGRVVYFPWDIDRIFWEVLGCRPRDLAQKCRALGDQRRAARASHGARYARRDSLAPGSFNDGAPGQPHEPDDDEGPIPRIDRRW